MAVITHPHAPVTRAELPWAIRHGAIAGIIAGVAFAAFEMLAYAVMWGGPAAREPLRMAGALLLGPSSLDPAYPLAPAMLAAIAVHLGLSVLYGATFAALAGGLRSGPIVIALGAGFGLILWLLNFYVIAPLLFPWFQGADPTLQFVGNTLFFGSVLGFLLWQSHERQLTAPHHD